MQLNQLKSLLSRFHIRPSHRLGQNFLLSDEILDKIIEASQLTKQDTVLEIGPGLGVLTQRLAQAAGQVIAIEKDRRMVKALRKIFKNIKNVKIVEGDALHIKTEELINQRTKEQREKFLSSYVHEFISFKVVANIPYYLTSKLLQNFLSSQNKPSLMTLLLQREVAERIVAKPGEMSILSVSVQFYADPEIIMYVPKENFYPSPEVDSAVVRIKPLTPSPLPRGEGGRRKDLPKGERPGEGGNRGVRFDVEEGRFFQLVKIGFSNKRKQLKNNLRSLPVILNSIQDPKKWIPGQARNDKIVDYEDLLSSIGINPKARAQDLSLEEWYELYQKLMI